MVKPPDRLIRQMQARGWTEADILNARDCGEKRPAVNRETGAAATRYIHPGQAGQS